MKMLKLLLLPLLFCACATAGVSRAPQRDYPVFLRQGRALAAFKMDLKAAGKEYNTLLTINETAAGRYKIKMLADFATIVVDADYYGGKFYYQYVLGAVYDKRAVAAFEDVIRVLVDAPADFINATSTTTNYRTQGFMNRWHFAQGASEPYKLEQIKGTIRKKLEFLNYKAYGNLRLPSLIICSDAHNLVEIRLTTISAQ
jgi:hypothetical protein